MAKKKGAHYIDKHEFTSEILKSITNYRLKLANADKEREEREIEDFLSRKACKNRKEAEKFVQQIYKNESLTKRTLELFLILGQRCINKLHYNNPEDKDDCLAFIYDDLIRYWTSFNPEKGGDAFAYFTTIVYTAAAKGWKKLYPEKYYNTISLSANSKNDGQGIYTA